MLSIGFKSDKGVARSGNEDSLFVLPEQNIFIVADGVGGHNSGELASRMAVGSMAQYVALHPIKNVNTKRELKRYFKECFEGANSLIYSNSKEESENRGMATTAVLCCVRDGWSYVVNVGDSRAYLVRDGELLQVTRDHTYVNSMIDSGVLTEEEARNHPDRNMITKALGGESTVSPDFFQFEVYKGDVIVLCTDGLYGEMSDETMLEKITSAETMHKLAQDLVAEANRHGGKDNISVICIKVLE